MSEISRFQFVAEAGVGYAYYAKIEYKNPGSSSWNRTGSQCSVSLGLTRDVNLYDISEIKEGAEVRFFMDVKASSKDRTASEVFTYKKSSVNYAKYNAKGNLITGPKIQYKGLFTYQNPFASQVENDKDYSGDISYLQFIALFGIGYAYRVRLEYRNMTGTASNGQPIREVMWHRTNSLGNVSLGVTKDVHLCDLSEIKEGAVVRFVMDIIGGVTTTAKEVFVYHKKANYFAQYNGKGTTLNPKIEFKGRLECINPNDLEKINSFKGAATVGVGFAYRLKAEYRNPVGSSWDSEWKTTKSFGNVALGQVKFLKLVDATEVKEGALVRFCLDVVAGTTKSAKEMFIYSKEASYMASYDAKGTTLSPTIIFRGLQISQYPELKDDAQAFAIPVSDKVLGLDKMDHTYVVMGGRAFGCFGRSADGRAITPVSKGNKQVAEETETSSYNANMTYGVHGVCHQMANRILWTAQLLVDEAQAFNVSVSLFGPYGKGQWNIVKLKKYKSKFFETIYALYQKGLSESQFREQSTEAFYNIYLKEKYGKIPSNMLPLAIKAQRKIEKIDSSLTETQRLKLVNEIAADFQNSCKQILTKVECKKLLGQELEAKPFAFNKSDLKGVKMAKPAVKKTK
ncbi:hypothetical protein [Fibrobacter sp. UWB11]|uniref:hypothetical protein n=1 Tax=Fibrobacter sp. UWB11 TaxID=1896202 RepID=UPI00092C0815|nr:hypothetical protein [Fibrobacter sp. UWB11]SIN96229.1 hypothetical protein SAMN05720758_0772 [Fibrobacter sp. UWB11]